MTQRFSQRRQNDGGAVSGGVGQPKARDSAEETLNGREELNWFELVGKGANGGSRGDAAARRTTTNGEEG